MYVNVVIDITNLIQFLQNFTLTTPAACFGEYDYKKNGS